MFEVVKRLSFSTALLLMAVSIGSSAGMAADLRVFVAGSLREVMPTIAGEYEKASGVHANITVGRSQDLRQQIERGKSADVFVSAAMDDRSNGTPGRGAGIASEEARRRRGDPGTPGRSGLAGHRLRLATRRIADPWPRASRGRTCRSGRRRCPER